MDATVSAPLRNVVFSPRMARPASPDEETLDFSSPVNPYPSPVSLQKVAGAVRMDRYPSRDNARLRAHLGHFHGLPPTMVAPCVGSTEAIYALPRLWKRPVLLGPTYGDYETAYGHYGRRPRHRLYPDEDEALEPLAASLRRSNWDLLIVCNPNNPTGAYLAPGKIAGLCREFAGKCIVVDETFQELGEGCESVVDLASHCPNLVVLRSMAKAYGIGGLRFGYVVAHERLLRAIEHEFVPWGMNGLIQLLVPAVLKRHRDYRRQWAKVLAQRDRLSQRLSKDGFPVSVGRSPFFLVHVRDASAAHAWLLENRRVLVCDCSRFGMSQWVRIMPRMSTDNARLVKALTAWRARS